MGSCNPDVQGTDDEFLCGKGCELNLVPSHIGVGEFGDESRMALSCVSRVEWVSGYVA